MVSERLMTVESVRCSDLHYVFRHEGREEGLQPPSSILRLALQKYRSCANEKLEGRLFSPRSPSLKVHFLQPQWLQIQLLHLIPASGNLCPDS